MGFVVDDVKRNLRQSGLTQCLRRSRLRSIVSPRKKSMSRPEFRRAPPRPLYTPEERARRDATRWTLVQGILAPLQFLVLLVSVVLVWRYLSTGEGQTAATASIVVKTLTLYTIMITGCLWEKVVFGCYLFAPSFYWEDMVSMLVLALHTAYLVALATGWLDARQQMHLALTAYATYAVNAAQFVWKLRTARLQAPEPASLRALEVTA